jgi:hypothetical protein
LVFAGHWFKPAEAHPLLNDVRGALPIVLSVGPILLRRVN